MMVLERDKGELFWNDPATIRWFEAEPAPEYWRVFFREAREKGVQKVLDLGCGAGRNTQMLFELGYEVYGCDLYRGMIKATISRLENAGIKKEEASKRVIMASMLNLPYPAQQFDALVSNGVYHNAHSVVDLNQTLKESARILKQNGYLCYNLFSSRLIAPELQALGECVYLTKEGLLMVLVSSHQFLDLAKKLNLRPEGEVLEYEREVATGKRAVMRGVLVKNC